MRARFSIVGALLKEKPTVQVSETETSLAQETDKRNDTKRNYFQNSTS